MIVQPQQSWLFARTGVSQGLAAGSNPISAFTTTGDIQLHNFIAECYATGTATAVTMQFEITNNSNGVTQTISAASGSLAGALTGSTLAIQPGALTNAPVLSASAGGANVTPWGAIWIPGNSTIKILLAGTITGNTSQWSFYTCYTSLQSGASLTPLF